MLSAANERVMRTKLRDELCLLKEADDALIRARGARDAVVANVQLCTFAFEQAQVALQMAEADLGLLDVEIGHLVARSDALGASMASTRTWLQTLATFPHELLALIFEEACAVDVATQQDASLDVDAAKCPYAIAGVCRRWREAALNTHAIWQCIAVSQDWVDAVDNKPFKRHLRHLLARSGCRSLDITISFHSDLEDSECARQNACFLDFFQPLYRVASRIRTLRIRRTSPPVSSTREPIVDVLKLQLMQLLRCSTPRLEVLDIDLSLWSNDAYSAFWLGYPDRDIPHFLPEAPALRSMHISGAPILLRRSIPPLLSLTSISLSHDSIPLAYLWDTLAIAPNLQYLNLALGVVLQRDDETVARLTTLPITTLVAGMNALHQLSLPTQVELPHLSTLDLPDWVFGNFNVTHALAQSVTSIRVRFYEIDSDEADERAEVIANLRLFHAVESAELEYIGAIAEDERFLFDAFCDPVTPMWPNLRTLRLQGLEDYDEGDVERDGLLRLLQIRNVSRSSTTEGEAETAPVAIESVEFDAKSVPPWLAIRVEAIMGDKCKLIDPVPPSWQALGE
ncbi:hypothetical protein EXIGLDRAFT_722030 [Exidia glandulosa HHB12029]|uniref:F-box domain-containing protein n=1 Tax=Exidia glandulosa HHB12029 TaxID=1314781 RepID=A0A165FIB5_EXIGL|nr:hypothetical protein EXIGLDRAFT_722030 [Exidia glandulosa HHB12029]